MLFAPTVLMPSERFFRVIIIMLAGASFILLHEAGHFLYATSFGLEPSFVLGRIPDSGIMGLSIGVSHLPVAGLKDGMVILGATILPLIVMLSLSAVGISFKSEEALLIAEVFLILIVLNLIPLPVNGLDANKLWANVLGAI